MLPILAIYQGGLFLIGHRVINGADFVTRVVHPHWGQKGLVVCNLAIVAAFLAAIIRLERRNRFRPGLFVPLVLESAIYASLLGTVIIFLLERSFLLSIQPGPDSVKALVLSLGAGVNEEIVFRLIGIGVLQYVFGDFFGLPDRRAAVLAVLGSSALFSAAHYVGAHGDALEVASFAYRFVAGVIFALLCRFRSFAVAVYTHAIYDILVLVPAPW